MLMFSLIISAILAEDIFFGEKFETGSYKTGKGDNDIFYWLFKARNTTRPTPPLIIWIEGGPGCSGMYSPLLINGPYNLFTSAQFEIKRNEYSWNNNFDFIIIDSPSGVGFSKLTTEGCTDSICSIIDIYVFLNKFFFAHPDYQMRDFYIAGQSYAGHFVPLLAEHIIKQSNSMINLKGIAIGNGWFNGINQGLGFPKFAYENHLISLWKYIYTNIVFILSKILLNMGFINLGGYLGDPYGIDVLCSDNNFNIYDIRKKEYDDHGTNIIKYFRLPEVIAALNISDRPYFEDESSGICNGSMWFTTEDDFASMDSSFRAILDSNVKVLLFTGDKDFICNVKTQEMWLSDFKWEGQFHFANDKYKDWKLGSTIYGKYKKYKNLMHLVVYNASHMVPVEQPYCSNVMIDQFIDGEIGS